MKSKLDNLLGKLPNLSEIGAMFGGGKGEENTTTNPSNAQTVESGLDFTSSEGDGSNIAKNTQHVSSQSSAVSQSASYEGDTEGDVVFVPLPGKVIPVPGGDGETIAASSSNGNGSVDGGELYIR